MLKDCHKNSYAFGLSKNKELNGIVTYGMPASKQLC